jgi:hypothetical protein
MVDDGPSEPPVDDIPILTSTVGLDYPLDQYQMTEELLDLAARATDLLVTDCMARFGLDWQPQSPAGNIGAPDRARRYGLLDLDMASELGYHPPDTDSGDQSTTGEQGAAEENRQITPEQDLVWIGNGASTYNGLPVPEGGCAGEAQRRLEEDAPVPPEFFVIQLEQQAGQRTDIDSRVQDGWSEWSNCMHQKGLDYGDPWKANDDPRWQTDVVTELEIATAVADVQCKHEVNLAGIWYAVEAAYQEQLIEEHSQQLTLVAEYVEVYAANVATVLDGE